jgi:hypothetical protein
MKKKSSFIIPIIALSLISFYLYYNRPITPVVIMNDFNKMVINRDVEKLVSENGELLNIYLKPGKLDKYKRIASKNFKNIPKEGPHFKLLALKGNTFKNELDNLQKDFNSYETINISHETKEKRYYIIDTLLSFWLIIFILPFIFWLIFLIDILKSDFKNSIDKLIWILIITFIPIIGLILYPIIGKKQRTKNVKEQKSNVP